MTKKEIREYIKELKSGLSKPQIHSLSDEITEQLLSTASFARCSRLFCYVSFNQEVETTGILLAAFSQGKKVAVPKISGGEMKFCEIESLKELVQGSFGILEPVTDREAVPLKREENLVIVPGLAFDNERNRIGYGRGYYDRFFDRYQEIQMGKIALAYEFQILDRLPVNRFDAKVDRIITPERVIW